MGHEVMPGNEHWDRLLVLNVYPDTIPLIQKYNDFVFSSGTKIIVHIVHENLRHANTRHAFKVWMCRMEDFRKHDDQNCNNNSDT